MQPDPPVTPEELAAATKLVGKCSYLINERDYDGCQACEWEIYRCQDAHVIFVNEHREELHLPELTDPYEDDDE